MEIRVFTKYQGTVYGATVEVTDTMVACPNDQKAFVRCGHSGWWRCIEWFILPAEVKEALLYAGERKYDELAAAAA